MCLIEINRLYSYNKNTILHGGSLVLVKRNCSVIKYFNQCTAAAMCFFKYNFMAAAKILSQTHAAVRPQVVIPALMYSKRNAQKN